MQTSALQWGRRGVDGVAGTEEMECAQLVEATGRLC